MFSNALMIAVMALTTILCGSGWYFAKREQALVGSQSSAKSRIAPPIFGGLSIYAACIGELALNFIPSYADTPLLEAMILGVAALLGFASAIFAWRRRERYRGIWMIGLPVNVVVALSGVPLLVPGSNC